MAILGLITREASLKCVKRGRVSDIRATLPVIKLTMSLMTGRVPIFLNSLVPIGPRDEPDRPLLDRTGLRTSRVKNPARSGLDTLKKSL